MQLIGNSEKKKWPIVLIVILSVLVLLGGVCAWVATTLRIDLQLNGHRQVVLQYGEGYEEAGAVAHVTSDALPFIRIPVSVQTSSDLIVSVLGSYTKEYKATALWMHAGVQRGITVEDCQAPVITLKTDPEHYTLPGTAYEEEGYTAWDNYDGDLTAAVTVEQEGDDMVYTVTDSSGNTAQVRRTIVYRDPEMPVLELKGESTVVLKAGTAYQEPGYTAFDNCDGDLTGQVTLTGGVDIYRPGTYGYTYTVTDSFGNTAQKHRTIIIEAIRQPDVVNPEGKVIYLTFDDGPGPHTERLLEILERYNVKATFFVMKTSYLHILPKIAEAGHAIGVHTTYHNYATIYASPEAFFNDHYNMRNILKQYTGIDSTIMRFPGGSSNTVSRKYCTGIMTALTQMVQDQGLQYFDWDVSSGDSSGLLTEDQIFTNVVGGIAGKNRNYTVVLQHDTKEASVTATERIIVWGLANGYSFQALTPSSPVCHHPLYN